MSRVHHMYNTILINNTIHWCLYLLSHDPLQLHQLLSLYLLQLLLHHKVLHHKVLLTKYYTNIWYNWYYYLRYSEHIMIVFDCLFVIVSLLLVLKTWEIAVIAVGSGVALAIIVAIVIILICCFCCCINRMNNGEEE